MESGLRGWGGAVQAAGRQCKSPHASLPPGRGRPGVGVGIGVGVGVDVGVGVGFGVGVGASMPTGDKPDVVQVS